MFSGFETSIEFQMSLLLFVALLGYLLASRINQSVVVGEILVGLLIGPSFLSLIGYTDFVQGIAHLGAVILLFAIGLEFQFKRVFRAKYALIAFAGVVVPWLGGYGLSAYWGYDFNTSVFLGTALTATSIAITANVLKEMGKLNTAAAEAIIGAAVIDDILGLLALSISTQIVGGAVSLADEAVIVLKAVLFLAGGAYFGQVVVRRWMSKLDQDPLSVKYPEFMFIFAMTVAFLYSLLAETIGLSAIVGAFIAGVSMESMKLRNSRDLKVGAEYLQMIFAAVFFVSLGILVDVHQLTWPIVNFLIALTLVAVATKLAGCYLAARLQGMGHRDCLIVGFGMAPRGEVAMIVALIGLTSQIITQEIYSAVIFMSLLTTIITPIVFQRWLYRVAGPA